MNMSGLTGKDPTETEVSHAMRVACRNTRAEVLDFMVTKETKRGISYYVVVIMCRSLDYDAASLIDRFEDALESVNPSFNMYRKTGLLAPRKLLCMTLKNAGRKHVRASTTVSRAENNLLADCEVA